MTSSSAALLEEAVRLHDRGALDEAASRYARVLAADPANVDAMFRLGRTHCQQGRFAEGIELFRKAIEHDPDHAAAHNLLGMALDRLGRPLEALDCFDRATACDPAFAEAWANKADSLSSLGRFAEAIKTYDRALGIKPTLADAWCNRGTALHAAKQYQQAIESFDRAIDANSAFANAFANRGKTLRMLGRFDDAIASLDQAISIRDDDARVHSDRSAMLRERSRLDEALESVERALSIDSSIAEIHCNRATILTDLGRPEEALEAADRAVALNPSLAETHVVRGCTLNELDRYDDAMAAVERALAIDPALAGAYHARTLVNLSLGRYAAARADSERAMSLEPWNPERAFNLSTIQLLLGDWKEGWKNYERRMLLRKSKFVPPPLPRWQGEQLDDGHLVLITEQALGDTIMFLRFVKVLADKGIRLKVSTEPRLVPLFSAVKGIEEVMQLNPDQYVDRRHTRWIRMMSIPHLFGILPDAIPGEVPYLFAKEDRVVAIKARLGAAGFKVGIVWQGGTVATNTRRRSFPLNLFAPIAEIPGVRLISLQHGPAKGEIEKVAFGDRIERLDDDLAQGEDEFSDLAALMMNIDLLISCDTSVVHLACALGRPVFIALPYNPDWRWLLGREDCPWYPTARLFRQSAPGEWSGVFDRIAAAVRERVSRV